MINLNDVLLAMSNIPVDDPIAEIWGRGLQGGYKIIEYTGTLPITITANGDALLDYRIYGADGGVGEPTENLIDADKPGTQRVELEPNTDYCLCKYTGSGQGGSPGCSVYDENNNRLFGDYINAWVSYSFTNPSNGAYARILFSDAAEGKVSFTKGRAANNNTLYPANYIPYGYKLPMVTIKNLFDPNGTYEANKYKDNDGTIHSYNGAGYYTQYMPINSEDLISVKNARGNDDLTIRLYYYDSQKNWIGRSGANEHKTDFTEMPLAGAAFIQLQLGKRYTANADKIIISQGRTTTPVYIGENQLDSVEGVADYVDKSSGKIVRRIKEYTFTGEETWYAYGVGFYGKKFQDAITSVGRITIRFSHFTARSNAALGSMYSSSFGDNCGCFRIDDGNVMLRSTTNFTTVEECKAYFKAQYDNGTPVKMWYIMTTPVEEEPPVPLPQIPTIDGTTVIDYDGDPKPSQMYVKYKDKSDGA